jgi:hypothetical protein
MGWEGLDWNDLAQVRDKWWALVNTFMILLDSITCEKVSNYFRN